MIPGVESVDDRATAATARGLPVPPLRRPTAPSAGFYVTTTVDSRGCLGDRSPLRGLGWVAGSSVSFSVVEDVVVVTRASGAHRITLQGHLRLPATLRHLCRLVPSSRVLVVAVRDLDLIEIYPPAAVDSMLLSYRGSRRGRPVR